jgi:hypothetical protein
MDGVSNAIHGFLMNIAMDDGGTYSQRCSNRNYVAIANIIEGSMVGVFNCCGGWNVADLFVGHCFVVFL